MPRLTVCLLGPPRIERDGVAIKVDTRKATALLAYLAAAAEPQSRDTLAALLWPEAEQDRARAALRRTLSALNKAVPDGALEIDRRSVALDPGPGTWVDLAVFRSHLAELRQHDHSPDDVCYACRVPLTEAAELYRGDFLAGFTLRDSPDFDDWQLAQSEHLRRELTQVLHRLTRLHASAGDWDSSADFARRALTLDPLDESAHRLLMNVYAWAGRRSPALRQYRECVRTRWTASWAWRPWRRRRDCTRRSGRAELRLLRRLRAHVPRTVRWARHRPVRSVRRGRVRAGRRL